MKSVNKARIILNYIVERDTDAPGVMICKPCRELYARVRGFMREDPMKWLEYEACGDGSEAD